MKARTRTSKQHTKAANGACIAVPAGKHELVDDEPGESDGACDDGGGAATVGADNTARSGVATAAAVLSLLSVLNASKSTRTFAKRQVCPCSKTRVRRSNQTHAFRGNDG
jgi:hypothetical protein